MWSLNEYNEDRSGLIQLGIEMLAVIMDCELSEIPSVCPIPADLDHEQSSLVSLRPVIWCCFYGTAKTGQAWLMVY